MDPWNQPSPSRVFGRVLARSVRRALLGMAAAVLYGATFGALIGATSPDPVDWVIGGVMFGAIGGPSFGLLVGRAIPARSPRAGRTRRARAAGLVGGLVFAATPLLLEYVDLVRNGPSALLEHVRVDPGGLLGWTTFMALGGALFGAIFGALSGLKAASGSPAPEVGRGGGGAEGSS